MWQLHKLRVRYQETDQMGVVYHANYANWLEIGRTEWIRAHGLTYRSLEDRGLLLPVVDLELHYRRPARYDDWVGIYTRVADYSGVRLQFENQIRRLDGEGNNKAPDSSGELPDEQEPKGELLVTGGTRHTWVNREWKPIRIDKEAPDLYALLSAAVRVNP